MYNNNFYFILSILKLIDYKKIIKIFLHHNNIFLPKLNCLKKKIFFLNCFQFLNQYKDKKINNSIFNNKLNSIIEFILFLISKKNELNYQNLINLIQFWFFLFTENNFDKEKENYINFLYFNNYDFFLFICYTFIMNLKFFPIFLLKKDYSLINLNENIILDILIIFEIMKYKTFEIKYNYHDYYKKIVVKISDIHNENKNIINKFKKIFKLDNFEESFKKLNKYFNDNHKNLMLNLFNNNKTKLGYLFLTKFSNYNDFINLNFFEENKFKINHPYFLTYFYFNNKKFPIFNQLIELINNDIEINNCFWYELENLNSQCKKYIDKIFKEPNSLENNFFEFVHYLRQHILTIQNILNNNFYEDFFHIQENSDKLEEINNKINIENIFFYFLENIKKTEVINFFDNFYNLFYNSQFIINEMKKNSDIRYKNFLNKILIHIHFILNTLYYSIDSIYILNDIIFSETNKYMNLNSIIQFNFIQVDSNERINNNKENKENLLNCIESLLKHNDKKYIINIYYIFDNLMYKEVSTQIPLQFYLKQFLYIINDLINYILNNENVKNCPKILFPSFENNNNYINMIPNNKYEFYSLLSCMNHKDLIKKYIKNDINILKNQYNYKYQKKFFLTLLSNKPIYGFNDLSSFVSKIFNDKEYLIYYKFNENNYNFLDDNTFETYNNIFQFFYNRFMEMFYYFKQKVSVNFVDFIDHFMNHNFFIDKKVDDKINNYVKLQIFKKLFFNEYLLNNIKLYALNCYKSNEEPSNFNINIIFKYKKGKKIKKTFEKTDINDLLNFEKKIIKKNKEIKIFVILNQTNSGNYDYKIDDIYNDYFINEYDSLFETYIIKYNKDIKLENQL